MGHGATSNVASAAVTPSATGGYPSNGKAQCVYNNPSVCCPYEYFCMWQGQSGTGEQFNVSTCNENQELPGSGWNGYGSWANNQTPGTDAYLLNSSYQVVYTTPAPVFWNSDYNWGPIWYADACR